MRKTTFTLAIVGLLLTVASVAFGNTGFQYTFSGCTVTVNVGQLYNQPSTAFGSAHSGDQDCYGTRARLSYRKDGTNYLTGWTQDSTPTVFHALVTRTNSDARYVRTLASSNGTTWGCISSGCELWDS